MKQDDLGEQASRLSEILDVPNSLHYFIESHKEIIDDDDTILLEFEKSQLDDFLEDESKLDMEQNKEIPNPSAIIEIKYEIQQSISGLRFVKDDKDEIFLYTEYFPFCSKFWLPTPSYEVYITEIKINILSDDFDPNDIKLRAQTKTNKKKLTQDEESMFSDIESYDEDENEDSQEEDEDSEIEIEDEDQNYEHKYIDYYAVCTGNLIQDIKDEKIGIRRMTYQVNKEMKTENIGLAIGNFKYIDTDLMKLNNKQENYQDQQFKNNNNSFKYKQNDGLNNFMKKQEKKRQNGMENEDQDDFEEEEEEEEDNRRLIQFFGRNGFEDYLLVNISEQEEIIKQVFNYIIENFKNDPNVSSDYLNNYKIVMLPNISSQDFSTVQLPNAFQNLCILDEKYVQQNNKLKLVREINIELNAYYYKHIGFSVLISKISTGLNYSRDYWILIGMNEFNTDYFRKYLYGESNLCGYEVYMNDQYQKLFNLIKKGEENAPVCSAQTDQLRDSNVGNEYFSHQAYIMKSKLIFHIFSNITLSQKHFSYKIVKNQFNKINTQIFLQKIEKIFKNATQIGYLKQNYIYSTGIPFFEISCQEQEKRIEIVITQTPIQHEYLNYYNDKRKELEKIKKIEGGISCDLPQDIDDSDEEEAKMDKEQRKSYRARKKIFKTKLQVPKMLNSMRILKGEFKIDIVEINENTQKTNAYETNLILNEDKPETRHSVNFQVKYQKNASKDFANRMSIKLDEFKYYMFDYQPQKMYDQLFINQLKVEYEKNPMSTNFYTHTVKCWEKTIKKIDKKNKEEKVLQNQLKHIIENIRQIRIYLENQKNLKSYIQLKLIKLITKYMSILDPNCLQITGFSLTKLIKLSFFTEQNIDLLKPFNFQNQDDYLIQLELIRSSVQVLDDKDQEGNCQQSSILVESLIDMLIKGDNSLNQFDDSQLRAVLIQSLMKIKRVNSKQKIIQAIISQVDRELLYPSYQNIIIKTIYNNLNDLLKNLKETYKSESLDLLRKKLKNIKNILNNNQLKAAKFQFKLKNKKMNKINVAEILLYGLKKLEKYKESIHFSNVYHLCLQKFADFIQTNYQAFSNNLQKELDDQKMLFLTEILWEQLVTGPSLICPIIRQKWIQIYKTFFFYFIPITVLQNKLLDDPKVYQFQVDELWATSFNQKIDKNEKKQKLKNKLFKKLNKLECTEKINVWSWQNMAKEIINYIEKIPNVKLALDSVRNKENREVQQYKNPLSEGLSIERENSNKISFNFSEIKVNQKSFKNLKKEIKDDNFMRDEINQSALDKVKSICIEIIIQFVEIDKYIEVSDKNDILQQIEELFIAGKEVLYEQNEEKKLTQQENKDSSISIKLSTGISNNINNFPKPNKKYLVKSTYKTKSEQLKEAQKQDEINGINKQNSFKFSSNKISINTNRSNF